MVLLLLDAIVFPRRSVELLVEVVQSFLPLLSDTFAGISESFAVTNANGSLNKIQSVFAHGCFGMAYCQIPITGIGCRFGSTYLGPATIDQQAAQFVANDFASFDLFHNA